MPAALVVVGTASGCKTELEVGGCIVGLFLGHRKYQTHSIPLLEPAATMVMPVVMRVDVR